MAKPSVQGNKTSFHIVKQATTASGIPATPEWRDLRRVSGDLTLSKGFQSSETINPNRNAPKQILTSAEVAGEITAELNITDPALEDAVVGALQVDAPDGIIDDTAATTSFDNATATVSAVGAFANAVEGQYLAAFGSVSNDRVFRIVTVTDADNIVVTPAPQDEAAGASVTLRGEKLSNGTTEQGFGVQKRIPTNSGTIYETYEGFQVGSISMAIGAQSKIDLSISFIGQEKLDGITQIAGSTDAASPTGDLIGTVDGIPEFWGENGVLATNETCFTDFSIEVNNNSAGEAAVGTAGYCGINHGNITVTGSLTSLVDGTDTTTANAEFDKFNSETKFPLGVTIKDAQGNYLVINMPSVQYTEFTRPPEAGVSLKNTGTYAAEGDTTGATIEMAFIRKP